MSEVNMDSLSTYTAFDSQQLLFQGTLSEVVLKIKKRLGRADHSSVLIFSDETGKTMDFNFQGSEKDVQKRLEVFVSDGIPKESSGPGRPKLGVISREISLLPRHWEWLASQPGGASTILRTLVEEAAKKSTGSISVKQLQERVYRFLSVMAGDLPAYEEALRALYKRDKSKFTALIKEWPRDIRSHSLELAKPVFEA
jgi:uncharacterized protein